MCFQGPLLGSREPATGLVLGLGVADTSLKRPLLGWGGQEGVWAETGPSPPFTGKETKAGLVGGSQPALPHFGVTPREFVMAPTVF